VISLVDNFLIKQCGLSTHIAAYWALFNFVALHRQWLLLLLITLSLQKPITSHIIVF